MALPATDNFNRADSANLGANWTEQGSGLAIISNAAGGNVNGAYQFDYWNADVFPNDQYSQAVIGTLNGELLLTVRAQNVVAFDLYALLIQADGDSYIFRWDDALPTLVSSLGNFSFSSTDVIKFTAVGTTLQAYKNGSPLGASATDATYASGSAGIGCLNIADRWDNWEGGAVVVSGGLRWASPSPEPVRVRVLPVAYH